MGTALPAAALAHGNDDEDDAVDAEAEDEDEDGGDCDADDAALHEEEEEEEEEEGGDCEGAADAQVNVDDNDDADEADEGEEWVNDGDSDVDNAVIIPLSMFFSAWLSIALVPGITVTDATVASSGAWRDGCIPGNGCYEV
jgi:hypothetical protein